MKSLLILVLLFLTQPVDSSDVVPIDQEPLHHLVMENEFLRVFDVTVPAHGATLMHHHENDYLFVTLGDSVVRNERMNEKPVRIELPDGAVRYVKGGFSHVARNLADMPFHNLTIDLKNAGAPVCGIDPASPCESTEKPNVVQELIRTEHLTVRMTTLGPGQDGPVHTHTTPHLGIAVDDLSVENHPEGKPVSNLSMKKGEYVWISSGSTHSLKNTGSNPVRILTIEVSQ